VKARTTEERIAGSALILLGVVAIATLPLWAPLAVAWLLATGRGLRGCSREANRMSGLEGTP